MEATAANRPSGGSIVSRERSPTMWRRSTRWVPLAVIGVLAGALVTGARGGRGVLAAVFVTGAIGASGKQGALDGKNVGVIICTNQNPFCAAWANSVKSGLENKAPT